MSSTDPELREEAWIGDAVLELYVRRWILETEGKMNGAKLDRFTSNQFLNNFGNPTAVEAQLGRYYEANGLEASFTWIETNLLPRFLQQEKNRQK
jgi:hypothetical protein